MFEPQIRCPNQRDRIPRRDARRAQTRKLTFFMKSLVHQTRCHSSDFVGKPWYSVIGANSKESLPSPCLLLTFSPKNLVDQFLGQALAHRIYVSSTPSFPRRRRVRSVAKPSRALWFSETRPISASRSSRRVSYSLGRD